MPSEINSESDLLKLEERAGYKPNGSARKQDRAAATSALFETPKAQKGGLWDFPLTDYGNAERLVLLFGQDLRYCHPWKQWLVWDRCRWVEDATAEVIRCAKQTVRKMYADAVKIQDSDRRDKALKHARATEKQAGLNAMINLASSELGIPVLPEELDANPLLLNLRNGTYDLENCVLRKHRREDLLTKLCQVDYDPDAKCPTWEAFQRQATGGNQDLIEFKQRLIGYSLSGVVREKCALFIYYGKTDRGKTTEAELLREMLGDYAGQISIKSIMEQRFQNGGSAASPDIAGLRGKRLVTCSEPAKGVHLDEAKIKYLTSMGTVQARHLHKEFFEFPQTWKFIMDCNDKPVIRSDDGAIWNRIRLVPWEYDLPEGAMDKSLPDKLRAELPGILVWAIHGWELYRGRITGQCPGLKIAEAVTRATSEYRSEMDVIGRFISERCIVGDYAMVGCAKLYETYKNWCSETGEKDIETLTSFGIHLRDLGYRKEKKEKGLMYEGIGLADGER